MRNVRIRKNCKQSTKHHTVFKPTKIPKGFVLLIDTNEQIPLFSSDRYTTRKDCLWIPIVRRQLKTGDYAIDGYENRACVERKMLSDFLKFIGAERNDKTIPKLRRMSQMGFPYLAIETSKAKLFPSSGKYKRSKLTIEHTRGFLKKITAWRIPYVYTSDRTELERYVLDHLCYVYEMLKGG